MPPDPAHALMAAGIGQHAAGHAAAAAASFRACQSWLPSDPAPPLNLAVALLALGDVAGARSAARRARLLAPALPAAHHTLGVIELALGGLTRAAEHFARAVALQPDFAAAWVDLGVVAYRQGRIGSALQATRRALAADPRQPQAAANLAVFDSIAAQSEAPLEALLARAPLAPEARINRAISLADDNRAAEALALLDGPTPEDATLAQRWRLQRCAILLQLERVAEAAALLDAIGPTTPGASLLRAQLALAHNDPHAAHDHAHAMQSQLISAPDAACWFDLARFWRGQHDWARDIQACIAGHRLLARAQPFSRPQAAAFFTASRACYSAERLRADPPADADPTPVFIVGMPRSGTTLTEQILAAHPAVHGGGERNALAACFAALAGDPRGPAAQATAAALDATTLQRAGARYLAELHALAPQAGHITDKMPGNFRLLGFAATLLPGARFLYCERDPRDIGLSIFQHSFSGYHPYAHDLGDLGWFIAQSRRMIAHWQSVLPGRILQISLRDWVEDFDRTLRRVLTFLELPYDTACTQFHDTGRRVMTLSRQQVRTPINRAGLDRWKHYADMLQPLIAELDPITCA